MANYGSKDLVITLTDAGAVARDITQFVRAINGIVINAMTEASHSFGDQWAEQLFSGFASLDDIQLDGFYDDTANGPDALWSRGATRVFKITYGSTKTTQVGVVMKKYKRGPVVEKAHTYQMTLAPTGAPTET